MSGWTAENLITLVSALTAAFVSIWNAVHGKALREQLCRHEIQAQKRHEAMVGALTEPGEGEEGVGS